MFVSKEPIAVCLDPPDLPADARNVIYIRPKLGLGRYYAVQDAALAFTPGADGADATMDFHVGRYNQTLLVESVIDWRGPAFAGRPCTPENIAELDDADPLVTAVLQEITTRNLKTADRDPKLPPPAAPASTSVTVWPSVEVLDSAPSGNGTYTSSAPNATAGRRKR